jgi:hypothetical protein
VNGSGKIMRNDSLPSKSTPRPAEADLAVDRSLATVDRELARADILMRGEVDPAWDEKTPVVSEPPPRAPMGSDLEVSRSGFKLRGLERWQLLLIILGAELVAGALGALAGHLKGWW